MGTRYQWVLWERGITREISIFYEENILNFGTHQVFYVVQLTYKGNEFVSRLQKSIFATLKIIKKCFEPTNDRFGWGLLE